MKKIGILVIELLLGISLMAETYTPTENVKESQRDFAADRFGILSTGEYLV